MKNAFHGPTSDGYEAAKVKWEEVYKQKLNLFEACSFLREMHRIAPFCFFNGNTFVSIIRNAIAGLLSDLSPLEAVTFRSVVGHYVAGTIDDEVLTLAIEDLP